VYEFCEEAIRNYNLNKEPDPFLLVFLDVILQFGNKFSVNPVEFLRYWEENMDKLSLAVPEELNAVRVMTIHKAKGLQFPVVIFPFAQETRRQTRDWLWIELEPHIAGIETAIVSNDKKLEQTQHNDLYQRELQKSSLDMLNLLYVVMTRPEQQLFILTAHPPLTTNTFDSLPKMFAQYLKFKGLYQASCDVYTFGSLDGLGSKTAKESTHEVKLVAFTSNDWRNRIRIRTRYQAFHSLADDSQKVRGTNMHKLLSWITTREDVPQVIQRARHAGLLHEDDLEHVQITINELLDRPELQNFYKDGIIVKNEPEILDASGSIHRPDRVVCYPDGKAAVIDYKTGYPEQEHEIQVRKYMELLSAMGYNPVKGIIIYLGDMIHVVEL
jgi:ATP-dependent exoDNAse (exonuclease V) beta subunit